MSTACIQSERKPTWVMWALLVVQFLLAFLSALDLGVGHRLTALLTGAGDFTMAIGLFGALVGTAGPMLIVLLAIGARWGLNWAERAAYPSAVTLAAFALAGAVPSQPGQTPAEYHPRTEQRVRSSVADGLSELAATRAQVPIAFAPTDIEAFDARTDLMERYQQRMLDAQVQYQLTLDRFSWHELFTAEILHADNSIQMLHTIRRRLLGAVDGLEISIDQAIGEALDELERMTLHDDSAREVMADVRESQRTSRFHELMELEREIIRETTAAALRLAEHDHAWSIEPDGLVFNVEAERTAYVAAMTRVANLDAQQAEISNGASRNIQGHSEHVR